MLTTVTCSSIIIKGGREMDGWINSIVESMFRHIGQTVTIFTTSGGLSGSGFSGVLLSVDCNVVRLLADVGAVHSV